MLGAHIEAYILRGLGVDRLQPKGVYPRGLPVVGQDFKPGKLRRICNEGEQMWVTRIEFHQVGSASIGG